MVEIPTLPGDPPPHAARAIAAQLRPGELVHWSSGILQGRRSRRAIPPSRLVYAALGVLGCIAGAVAMALGHLRVRGTPAGVPAYAIPLGLAVFVGVRPFALRWCGNLVLRRIHPRRIWYWALTDRRLFLGADSTSPRWCDYVEISRSEIRDVQVRAGRATGPTVWIDGKCCRNHLEWSTGFGFPVLIDGEGTAAILRSHLGLDVESRAGMES